MRLLKPIDSILNQYTMYKVVAWGLGGLLAIAEVLALMGVIGVSASGLAWSTLVLAVSCYLVNRLLSAFFKAPCSRESWAITALILVFIVPPVDSLERALLVGLVGIIAMVSKYLITWRGSHLFNPAAFGAFVVSVTGLLPITWWVATPNLLPFTVLLALIVLRKQRQFSVFLVFALVAVSTLLFNGLVLHNLVLTDILKNAALSWPIVFMGSIMLIEPVTMPSGRSLQLIYAALVGVVFAAQLNIWALSTTPQFALLVGNLFALAVAPPFGAMLRLKRGSWLGPDIYEVVFDKPRHLKFWAGQYIEMTLPHAHTDFRGNRRSFSIASAPSENVLRFAVRTFERSSSFKRALTQLPVGARVRIATVAGAFTFKDDGQPLALVAGGIGITPFRSMIAELLLQGAPRDIVLVYIASSKEHFAYKPLFEEARARGLKVEYVVGRMAGEDLPSLVPDLDTRQIYISGPDAMVSDYQHVLMQTGISRQQIHTDHFTGY